MFRFPHSTYGLTCGCRSAIIILGEYAYGISDRRTPENNQGGRSIVLKRFFPKVLVCLAAALLTAALCAAAASAAEIASGDCGTDAHWSLDSDGTLTVSGTGAMADYSQKYKGGGYIYDAPWYDNRADITSVVIGSGITSIGNWAFYDCANLTGFTIPDSLTSIGSSAFRGCGALTEITIPETVSKIEMYAFDSCNGLTSVTIPNSTDIASIPFHDCLNITSLTITGTGEMNWILPSLCANWTMETDWYTPITTVVIGDGITGICDEAFSECGYLTDVTIPDSVTSIGSSAFQNCRRLTHVAIPASVTSIGNSVFKGCSNLTGLTIPAGVTSIGNAMFQNCRSLKSVTIPDSVTSIGDSAFQGCINLPGVTIPAGVTSIGAGAFQGCSYLTDVTIPAGVTSIGNSMFRDCTRLTGAEALLDHVTGVGDYAFSGCTGLTGLTIPAGVTSIGSRAFSGCTGLTNAVIPAGTSMGTDVFDSCENLTMLTVSGAGGMKWKTAQLWSRANPAVPFRTVSIGSGVTSLSAGAFGNCVNLTAITIPNSVKSIGNSALSGCSSLTSLTIPDSVTLIGDSALSGCSSLRDFTIPASVTSMGSGVFSGCTGLKSAGQIGSGCNYEYGWTTFVPDNAFSGCGALTKLAVPNTLALKAGALGDCPLAELTITGTGAMKGYFNDDSPFYKSTTLKTLVLSEGLTSVGYHAFEGCTALDSISLPSTLLYIRDAAFKACYALTDLSFPENLKSIDDSAFYGCTGLTSLMFPKHLITIGYRAFRGCENLEDVWFPVSIEGVEDYAFFSCDCIGDVYYGGSQTQWSSVDIGKYNTSISDAAIHYDSTTPIITMQPSGVSTAEGGKATFTVAARGSGTLRYQWQWSSNGTAWYNTALTGYNTPTLTVTAGSAVNGRYYRCIVSDSTDSVASAAAKLSLVTGPAITGLPQSQAVTSGTKASFTVTARGTGTLKYQWQWSADGKTWANTSLTGYNTRTLTLTASAAVNGRYYRCIVSDSQGSVTSGAAKLTVIPGPAITAQPQNLTVTTGTKAAFTVTATGTGTLRYQWQWSANGTAWYDTALTGCSTKTLTVTAGAAVNGRYYRCVVSDSQGSAVSAAAKLTVIPGPAITAQPQNLTVTTGTKAAFTVAATGTGTLNYRWQWSPDGSAWANTSLTGYNTATLTVTASATVNGRYYRCVVTDANGSVTSAAAKLTVIPGPAITAQPRDQSVSSGRYVAFTVSATGTGTLSYQWQWSANKSIWYNTSLPGCRTKTLTVAYSYVSNDRYFRCIVTDSNGSVTSDAAKLTVITSNTPSITAQPASVTAAAGSKASFTVTAKGSGTLTYQWQYSTNGTTWYNTALTGYNTPTLTITASSAVSGRYYRCVVSNDTGSVTSAAARLTVT